MHFRVILKLGEERIKQYIQSLNQEKLINEFVNQIFGLSRHIEKRYNYLYKAFWFFMACLILFFIIIIYIAIIPSAPVENLMQIFQSVPSATN
jgi:Trk-type K+ transport system membrane component